MGMINKKGLDGDNCKFVTHAWSEGVMEFLHELLSCRACKDESRGEVSLWICFLANPQTWPTNELKELLGKNPWMSPFHTALCGASEVICVRNPREQMYCRLWCV